MAVPDASQNRQLRLVLAVVPEARLGKVETFLRHRQRRFTRLLAQGGFLRRGSAVLILVTPQDEVDDIVRDLRQSAGPAEPQARGEWESGTVVFVLPLEASLTL